MDKKLVALTFDDGPSDTTSDLVMDKLEKYNIPATFFLIGEQIIPERVRVIERELSLGCEIENHSWTHSDMTKFTKEQMKEYRKDRRRQEAERQNRRQGPGGRPGGMGPGGFPGGGFPGGPGSFGGDF